MNEKQCSTSNTCILQEAEDYLKIERFKYVGIENYSKLGLLQHSLLHICRGIIISKEKESAAEEIAVLLELAMQLIPEQELEYLDKIYTL